MLGELDHWEQLVRESASFLEHVESQAGEHSLSDDNNDDGNLMKIQQLCCC